MKRGSEVEGGGGGGGSGEKRGERRKGMKRGKEGGRQREEGMKSGGREAGIERGEEGREREEMVQTGEQRKKRAESGGQRIYVGERRGTQEYVGTRHNHIYTYSLHSVLLSSKRVYCYTSVVEKVKYVTTQNKTQELCTVTIRAWLAPSLPRASNSHLSQLQGDHTQTQSSASSCPYAQLDSTREESFSL